jgi:CRP/FNR family transcriptional regulator, cyclic AMP receptor protein
VRHPALRVGSDGLVQREERGENERQSEQADDERESSDQYYDLLAHGRTPQSISAGKVIFDQGEQGDSMYIVREGSVALKDGDRLVETVTAPGLFGEMALIEHEPRSLTAVAATDGALVEIPVRHFWVLVHETPYFAQLVMSVMARRLRRSGGTT